jgi:hypothetical protein
VQNSIIQAVEHYAVCRRCATLNCSARRIRKRYWQGRMDKGCPTKKQKSAKWDSPRAL